MVIHYGSDGSGFESRRERNILSTIPVQFGLQNHPTFYEMCRGTLSLVHFIINMVTGGSWGALGPFALAAMITCMTYIPHIPSFYNFSVTWCKVDIVKVLSMQLSISQQHHCSRCFNLLPCIGDRFITMTLRQKENSCLFTHIINSSFQINTKWGHSFLLTHLNGYNMR
jgi:hypothetical protein